MILISLIDNLFRVKIGCFLHFVDGGQRLASWQFAQQIANLVAMLGNAGVSPVDNTGPPVMQAGINTPGEPDFADTFYLTDEAHRGIFYRNQNPE